MREHWPEYLMEAWGLGTVMVAVAVFATLLEYPGSPLRQAIDDALLRRALMGAAMGLVAVAISYSGWGKRSGAHINPAVTLTFLFLGRIKAVDAFFYVLAHFIGGTAGVLLAVALIGVAFSQPPVFLANTLPGSAGISAAFVAETALSFGLMLLILASLASKRMKPFTGLAVGLLLAVFITAFRPLSGASMNPARSFASAMPVGMWQFLWIFFIAPPLGMLAAAVLFRWFRQNDRGDCAKLNHDPAYHCIFCGHVPPAIPPTIEEAHSHVDRTL